MKYSIILLETDKPSNLLLVTTDKMEYRNRMKNQLELHDSPHGISDYFKPQHLYILSQDEIKEGDWYYLKSVTTKDMILKASEFKISSNCKKIISNTNLSLGLPWIDDTFIQDYVKSYNSGHPITEVELETFCEYGNECPSKGAYKKQHLCKIGIKTKSDGSVIIKI